MDLEYMGHIVTSNNDRDLSDRAMWKKTCAALGSTTNIWRTVLLVALSSTVWLSQSTIEPSFPPQVTPVGNYTSTLYDDYRDIPPSTKLRWHACFDQELRCAKLQAPMDYGRSMNNSSSKQSLVEMALIMLPGRDHLNNDDYSISPLLLNPGGPGGSGVDLVRGLGHAIQRIVGHDRDIVSFDPRGVGYTRPSADCFSFPLASHLSEVDDYDVLLGQFNRAQFAVANEAVGLVNSTGSALSQRHDAARAIAQLCKTKDGAEGEDGVLRHLDTQSIARDMLYIIDAWDAWHDTLSASEKAKHLGLEVAETKGKLVYWGFSYGTLLGATFAAMFPDRVGRIVLDGVIDAEESTKPFPVGTLEDADAVLDSFFEYCGEAGATKCALARDGDETSDIRERTEMALHALRDQSLVGVNPITQTPSVITWSILKTAAFGALYSPVTMFPLIAQIYDLLHRGDYGALHASIPQLHSRLDPKLYCSPRLPSSSTIGDAQTCIECSGQHRVNATVPELRQHFERLSKVSSFADVFMNAGIQCSGWSVEAVNPPMWRTAAEDQIKTSFPMLFISNTYDPITPLRSGVKMAQRFAAAGLVEQRGEGHCSFAEVSLCTLSKIGAYFREGKVPLAPKLDNGQELRDGVWERCETNERPWQPWQSLETATEDTSMRDGTVVAILEAGLSTQEANELLQAWKHVQDHMKVGAEQYSASILR